MRKTIVAAALLTGISPVSALAQVAIPPSGGPTDDTNNVMSARIGMPGGLGDPVTQYQNQRALNNLPGEQANGTGKPGRSRPAAANELTAGAAVNDKTGALIAKVEEVDPDGVIVSTGAARVKVPTNAFGHNNAGLLLDMTKAQFQQIVAQANAAT